MRASSDLFVVGMTGVGTALFLTQLLIVSQQIVAANNHIQAELASERASVPVTWMGVIRRPPPLVECLNSCFTPGPPIEFSTHNIRLEYPQRALKEHVQGFVDFILTIKPDGSVASAKVEAEVPQGYGFAAAAAKALPQLRFDSDRNTPHRGPVIKRWRAAFKLGN